MITIKLCAADREALGAPEAMHVDPQRFRLAEVRALKRETGYTVEALSQALQGGGLEDKVEATAAMVWLALRRHGVEVAYEDLDFDLAEMALEVEAAGKAPERPSSSGS